MTAPTPAWTPGRMYFQLDADDEAYVLSGSSAYSGSALAEETSALGDPAVMMIAREQFAFMRFLAAHGRCRRALDIGTFTGMSALALAEGVGRTGAVVTIDRDDQWLDVATRHWQAAMVADRIEFRRGEALDVLAALAEGEPFDLIFLDADKAKTRDYVEMSLRLLAPGGLIVVDNTLWHGWVLDPAQDDAATAGMRDFNARIVDDPRVETVMLPIADGIMLIRRRG